MILVQPSTQPIPTGMAVGGEVTVSSPPADPQASEANPSSGGEVTTGIGTTAAASTQSAALTQGTRRGSSGGRELRRARIVVTVRRTESYKRWLEENPLQAIIASETDEDDAMGSQSEADADDPKSS
jgi:hypothetical protein